MVQAWAIDQPTKDGSEEAGFLPGGVALGAELNRHGATK